MIVTYNPLVQKQQEDLDRSVQRQFACDTSDLSGSKWPDKVRKNLRNPFSATTEGEHNLPPEIAPLIFSDDEDENENTETRKKARPWDRMNNYFDNRARARYVSLSNSRQGGFH
jgi:hypothetical protein